MIDSLSLLNVAVVFFVIVASPGPATVSNAAVAMSQGRKASLMYGAGLSTGLLFWGVIAATGLGVILQSSVHLLPVLKIAGGVYLLGLAYTSSRDVIRPGSDGLQSRRTSSSSLGWFVRGLLLNVSNPKSILAWMAALSVGLGSNDGIASLILGVSVCVVVGLVTNAAYSVVFSLAGVMAWYDKAGRQINAVAAAVFALGGVGLIRSALSRGSA